jgi:hypothetical protein
MCFVYLYENRTVKLIEIALEFLLRRIKGECGRGEFNQGSL